MSHVQRHQQPRRRKTAVVALSAATVVLSVALPALPALADDSALGDTDGPVAVQVPAPVLGVESAAAIASLLPATTASLPSTLDAKPFYVEQDSCDPYAKTGTVALANLMRNTYGAGSYGIERECYIGNPSEHKEGRAVDWMLSVNNAKEKAAGDAATAWLSANNGANARRLGVQYIIWNRRMWRAYAPERGWTRYSGSNPHTDHTHISLTWDGAMKRTSWWSGKAVTAIDRGPCRIYNGQWAPIYVTRRIATCPDTKTSPRSKYSDYSVGQSSSTIAIAQKAMGITADGQFGDGTRRAVLAYQRAKSLPVTGVLDQVTWLKILGGATTTPTTPTNPTPTPTTPTSSKRSVPAKIVTRYTRYIGTRLTVGSSGAAVKALQAALGVTADGSFGSGTKSAVIALQAAGGVAKTGVVTAPTWHLLELRKAPWIKFVRVKVRRGSTGPAVVAMQKAMGITADGVFGSGTATKVKALQGLYSLDKDGIVGRVTWRAICDNAAR